MRDKDKDLATAINLLCQEISSDFSRGCMITVNIPLKQSLIH
jgi:hypothetical protein